MESLWIAMIAAILILMASVVSIEAGISVALIEITLGVIAGNFRPGAGAPACEARMMLKRGAARSVSV